MNKHFGSGGGGSLSPLLAVLIASNGRLELDGKELEITCRELAHDLRSHPLGRVVVRQREADDLALQLAMDEGQTLSLEEREARLRLRDKLARLEDREARVTHGLNLMLGNADIAPWILKVFDEREAAEAISTFARFELDELRRGSPDGLDLRVIAPKQPEIRSAIAISREQVSKIVELTRLRTERYNTLNHTNTVAELPPEARPLGMSAVMIAILRLLEDGQTLEQLKMAGLLEIGSWNTLVV